MPVVARKDGRRNASGLRKYQICEIRNRQREIIRRVLLGQSGKEIAEDLDITPVVVSYVINSELGKEKLGTLQDEADHNAVQVRQRIAEVAPQAIKKIADIMNDANASLGLQFRAAADLADRGGYKPVTHITGSHLHGIVTAEDLRAIKDRANATNMEITSTEIASYEAE